MERQQLRRMLASFMARGDSGAHDDQLPLDPSSSAGHGDTKKFVLRMGDGRCIHEPRCHHTRRQELAPTKFFRCQCIHAIVRKNSYYLDWKGYIHENVECEHFEGRPDKANGGGDIKMAKAVFQVCSQCF